MLGKSHVILSEAILLPIALNTQYSNFFSKGYGITNPIYFIIGVALGALLPDIDEKNSILGRFNPFASLIKHRTITHTLWMALLISIIFLIIGMHSPFCWGIILGYWAHLIEDSFSRKGISWLYPFISHKHNNHYGYITGGIFEKIVVFMAFLFIIFTIFKRIFKFLF